MAERSENVRVTTFTTLLLRLICIALALLVLLLTAGCVLGALATIKNLPAETEASAAILGYLLTGIAAIIGVTAAGLLLAMGHLLNLSAAQLRQSHTYQASVNRLTSLLQEYLEKGDTPQAATPVYSPTSPAAAVTLDYAPLIEALHEIRDAALLTDAQRQNLAQTQIDAQRERLRAAAILSISVGNFPQADQDIAQIRQLSSMDDRADSVADELSLRLDADRSARAQQEVSEAAVNVRHLMSISRWQQAQEIVTDLRRRYGDEPTIVELADYVHRERDALEKEHYAQLMTDLKDNSDRRQWRRALEVINDLIQRYPLDRKVERLQRDQLATIRENAEAQERREEEALFTDLLHRQRYSDAADVARRVIGKFPNSPAAVELGKLLPKVEELVRQEAAKR